MRVIELQGTKWYELPEADVFRMLESEQIHGLTRAKAETRIQHFGTNEVTTQKWMSDWMRFLLQFAQPLMYILLLASGVTLLLR